MTTNSKYVLDMVDIVSAALKESPNHAPDAVDFSWYNDDQLLELVDLSVTFDSESLEYFVLELERRGLSATQPEQDEDD